MAASALSRMRTSVHRFRQSYWRVAGLSFLLLVGGCLRQVAAAGFSWPWLVDIRVLCLIVALGYAPISCTLCATILSYSFAHQPGGLAFSCDSLVRN